MKSILIFFSFILSVLGSGQITFLHSPKSISFNIAEHLEQKFLKDVFSSTLGFTTPWSNKWSGLKIDDPFHYSEAIVLIVINGIDNLDIKGVSYPIITNEDEETTWTNLKKSINERFLEQNNTLLRLTISDLISKDEKDDSQIISEEFNKEDTKLLNTLIPEDIEFLKELNILNKIADKIDDKIVQDGIPDAFWFIINNLHAFSHIHGPNSESTLKAKELLANVLIKMKDTFVKAYTGEVVFAILATDVIHTRRIRSVEVDPEDTDRTKYNLSKNYDEDYPVIFNILLWFIVAFVFSIIAICVAIGSMDPGRDSIIYRMTSNRMKKDN